MKYLAIRIDLTMSKLIVTSVTENHKIEYELYNVI